MPCSSPLFGEHSIHLKKSSEPDHLIHVLKPNRLLRGEKVSPPNSRSALELCNKNVEMNQKQPTWERVIRPTWVKLVGTLGQWKPRKWTRKQ